MYRKTVLENGLRVLTSFMPHTKAVSIGFFVGIGSRYEGEGEEGISHFIEHMLFKGTKRRPTARDIATAIEGIGGVFNASTGKEMTFYWAKVAQPHLSLACDVLTDMLLNPKFDTEEIEKEKRVIIEEINLSYDIPDSLVHLLFDELIWPDHPVGRDVGGTKESVAAFDREALSSYMRKHYTSTNTVVSVAGAVEHEEVVELISTYLSDFEKASNPSYLAVVDEQAEPRVRVQYKETEQAHLCIGVRGLERDHPDRFNLRLLNAILGEGMSSRLFLEVREKRGLAYSVGSYISMLKDTGAVGVHAGVDPRRTEEAIEVILEEWDKLRREEVPAEELEKAKEFVKGRLSLQMEDSFSVASWFGQQELLSSDVLTVSAWLVGLGNKNSSLRMY